ncbi:MAG: hypothetical protein PHH59_09300 [Methylovulum sp.]|uniref:hypothetical protein n=1 Tax=Methylovulum sp. TaxID=1916980 RepID=UPI0026062F3F|nr:hypothetical protein [Methylovulum sp.]MDD2724199.1 hypothetical protein [Methylovulum sp.]MDD5123230.1 hypothetical protein [Methylovulum sp.]
MNAETLLLRQINPSFIQNGRVTSQAFRPTPKDENKLSVYDGDQISPENSWIHFTSNPQCRSDGVMAISHEQCDEQSIPVIPDGIPFPEHAYLNFSNMSKGEIERKAKALVSKAKERGWLYQAR